ncbi:conserved hypothetical protein [Xenorhabdus bovienii str. feltiae Florida]|nr:conserved hypothetical protein [Xenorhabdus bovienii str. feltiae France]CDG90831.1 conserved hypothetical protein [Xenorhabdus bovienii str. feltiae Florida]
MSNDIDGIMETFKGVSAQGHRLELAQKPGSLPEVPLMRQNRPCQSWSYERLEYQEKLCNFVRNCKVI